MRARSELESFPVLESADVERKLALHAEVEAALALARLIGDIAVACAIADEGGLGAYDGLLPQAVERDRCRRTGQFTTLRAFLDADLPEGRPPRRTFHWPLEFPEVFGSERGGFDAVVANPPFLGGQRQTATLGEGYRNYLIEWVAEGRRGSADLAAYFVIRFVSLLRERGCMGSLATNSIGQGVAREICLGPLLAGGAAVFRAVPSRPWPGTANLEIAELWLARRHFRSAVLSGRGVAGITAELTEIGRVGGDPLRLTENSGLAFQGSIVVGQGFVLEPDEAAQLLSIDPRNAEVVLPYLNGQDLSSRPDQSASRSVIYFRDWDLETARTYGAPFTVVENEVRPERARNPRREQRELWWRFERPRVALYEATRSNERVLVKAQVGSTWGWVFVPNGQVFDAKLNRFRVRGLGELRGPARARSPRMDVAILNHTENRRHIHADDVL